MAANSLISRDHEARLLPWVNALLEASVLYLLLAALARPRDGTAALLPLLASLALPAGLALRGLLDAAQVQVVTRRLANLLAALAWSFLAARIVAPPAYWQADEPRLVLALGAVFGLGLAAGLQPLAFWASLLFWWRGRSLSHWLPSADEAIGRLYGTTLLCLVIIVLTPSGEGETGSLAIRLEQAVAATVFLAAALAGTSLARRREMSGGPILVSGRASGEPDRWSTHLPLAVIAVSLLVLLLAGWGADALAPSVLVPLAGFGLRLAEAAANALTGLVAFLSDLWSGLAPPSSAERPPATGSQPPSQSAAPPDFRPPEGLALGVFWLSAFGGLILLALLVLLARRAMGRDSEGEIEAVAGDDGEAAANGSSRGPSLILALLLRLARAIRPLWRPVRRPSGGRPKASPRPAPALSAHAFYLAFLEWTVAQGLPRQSSETPDEFRDRLAVARPELDAEAGLLTDLFVSERYGGLASSSADLHRARLALERLRSLTADPA